MPTNLETLQATYTSVITKIAEVLANPRPDYSIDGVSLSFGQYYQMLLNQEKMLREIPGVVDTLIDLVSVNRG